MVFDVGSKHILIAPIHIDNKTIGSLLFAMKDVLPEEQLRYTSYSSLYSFHVGIAYQHILMINRLNQKLLS